VLQIAAESSDLELEIKFFKARRIDARPSSPTSDHQNNQCQSSIKKAANKNLQSTTALVKLVAALYLFCVIGFGHFSERLKDCFIVLICQLYTGALYYQSRPVHVKVLSN